MLRLYPEDTYLNVCAQFLEDLVDLVFEPSAQHLVSFIQNKHLDPFWGYAKRRQVRTQLFSLHKRNPDEQDLRYLHRCLRLSMSYTRPGVPTTM